MRRKDYWHAQRPEYFFFFWNGRVFPGFSDCVPESTYLPTDPGPSNCTRELRQRLQKNFPLVQRTDLFEVYDLRQASVGR
jgi:hypothetical protein